MQVCSFEKRLCQISLDQHSAILLSSGEGRPGRVARRRASKPNQLGRRVRNRVLMIGRMRELALYRAELLRHAGFDVRTPETKEEAVAIIERSDFDVAVLSYTLPSNTVEEMADQVREHCPNCPIVAIALTNRFDRRIAPDAIALAAHGPRGLLSALLKVLNQS